MSRLSRRALLCLGAGTATAALAGCGSTPPTVAPLPTNYAGEAHAAALLFAVEAALLTATAVAVSTAVSGRYGSVPPALTAALGAAGDHHNRHIVQWRTRLIAAGYAAPPADLLTPQLPELAALASATSATEAVMLLASVQDAATATYLAAAPTFTSAAGRTLLATIAPVEAEHSATLGLLAGVSLESAADFDTGALTMPAGAD